MPKKELSKKIYRAPRNKFQLFDNQKQVNSYISTFWEISIFVQFNAFFFEIWYNIQIIFAFSIVKYGFVQAALPAPPWRRVEVPLPPPNHPELKMKKASQNIEMI